MAQKLGQQAEGTSGSKAAQVRQDLNLTNSLIKLPNEILWQIINTAPQEPSMAGLLRTCRALRAKLTHEFYSANGKRDPAMAYFALTNACFHGHQRPLDEILHMQGCSYDPLELLEQQGSHWIATTASIAKDKLVAPLRFADGLINRLDDSEASEWIRFGDMPPLHYAVLGNQQHIAEYLLDKYATSSSAMLSDTTMWANTPLHYATTEAMVDLLVQAGVNPLAHNSFGYTPLQWFMKRQWPAEWWVETPDRPQRSVACFRRLVEVERAASASQWQSHQLLSTRNHAATHHEPARTLMGLAIRHGPEYVQVLLDAGADPNAVESRVQARPLFPSHAHIFRRSDAHTMASETIRKRTCFHYIWCPTALQMAVTHGGPHALTTIELLVSHGADVDAIVCGHTALMLAADSEHIEIVEALVQKYGADPNLCSRGPEYHVNGECFHTPDVPLTHAIRAGNVAVVTTLLRLGANARLAAPPEVVASIFEVPNLDPDTVQNFVMILNILQENGVDLGCNFPRTTYYHDKGAAIRPPRTVPRQHRAWAGQQQILGRTGVRGGERSAPTSWSNDNLWDTVELSGKTFEPAINGCTVNVRRPSNRHAQRRFAIDAIELWEQARALSTGPSWMDEEPPLPRKMAEVVELAGSQEAQQSWLMRRFAEESTEDIRVFRHYPSWTLLDDAMHGSNEAAVVSMMALVDPLSGLRGARKMQYTPLGNLIMTTNFGHRYKEHVGPWTDQQWRMACLFVKHGGRVATARYPTSLLAQMLCQAVARLTSDSERLERIQEFQELLGCPLSFEGPRALGNLVRHDAYWSLFEEHSAECRTIVDESLVATERIIRMICQRSIKIRWPSSLPNREWRASFALLFGDEEGGEHKVRPQRRGGGRRRYTRVFLT